MRTFLAAAVAALSLLPACPGRAQTGGATDALTHRYDFATGANDLIGTAHGALMGGATLSGGAVVLDGASGYVNLPNNLVTGYTSITIETWVTDTGSAGWARIYDFGNSVNGEDGQGGGTRYMFLALPSGLGNLRGGCTITGGGAGEQVVEWPAGGRPAVGQKAHVVWTTDGASQVGKLFVNAALVGSNLNVTLTPSALGPTVNDWLGRSQFNDPYFKGAIDEFRIYSNALSDADILRNYQNGPDVLPFSGPVRIVTQPRDQTVDENQSVTFSADVRGAMPISVQWFCNGSPVPSATNLTLSFTAAVTNDNSVFQLWATNVATNITSTAASSNAVLHVIPDTTPPGLVRAQSLSSNGVQVFFSEPIQPDTATNLANYALTNAAGVVNITNAVVDGSGTLVTLGTDPLPVGVLQTLTVNHLRDLAVASNVIAADSQAVFMVLPFVLSDIGAPAVPGWIGVAGDGLAYTAGGTNFGGMSDQGSFAWEPRTGDFDVQLHLRGLGLANVWSEAGLMARVSLAANSAFVGTLATPLLAGAYQKYRTAPGGTAVSAGSFAVSYPGTWLRLQRAGQTFTSYASYDGETWAQVGSVNVPLTNTMFVGVAVASHSATQTTTAEFTDYGATASTAVGVVASSFEPPGSCTRRTGLVISEIMYNPAPRADGRRLEFVEIFNSNPFFHDLGGHRLSGGIEFTFPAGTIIPGGGFIVVAASPADVQAIYGVTNVFGPYTNTLKQTDTLRLRDEQEALMLEISYRNTPPWPVAADGAGHSLALVRPSYGEGDPRAWAISEVVGGSPGTWESYRPSPLRDVFINEVRANSGAAPEGDFVELYNHSNRSNDISGCVLTDNAATNKFVIPPGTVLPPRGFLAFTQPQLGFGLKAEGDTIWFKNPVGTRVLDAVRFGAQAEGVSFGRSPDGAEEFSSLAASTPDAANSAPLVSDIVINEIMYNPVSRNDDDQFIELYNQGANTVNVGGWKFVDGISFTFTFPPDVLIPPDGYVVVARNRTNLLARHANLTPTNTIGNFGGSLAHGGERLALAARRVNVTTNAQGLPVTNVLFVVVDEVTYGTGGRWGQWADGGGSSLELIDPRSNHRLAANWADSDETAKAPWTTIQTTGTLDLGANYNAGPTAFMQIGLMDPGEALVDDVEVLPQAGSPNYVANPTFNTDLSNWSLQGCFSRSSLETGAGYGGSGHALHLRTANRLFTLANSAQGNLNNTTLTNWNTATLRFKARWLKGSPEILMRLQGNWLEVAGSMQVPANLGTPGARNSRAVTNAGPAIYDVVHAPTLPAAGQPAAVTARVADPDGVTNLTLRYRVDPSVTYASVAMVDDGTGADAVAGDGIFTGAIPAQTAGTVVAFIVTAADARGATNRFPALLKNNGPEREGLLRWGDPNPASSFGAYHLWLSGASITRWNTLPNLSNEDIDGTLIYNNRVIYNVGLHYAGSPYHQADRGAIVNGPTNGPCHYNMEVPPDDRLLGFASFNKLQWPGNDIQDDTATQNNNDATLQREQAANMLLRGLGSPWAYRRFISVYLNGVQRGAMMEDALRPSVSVPDTYFPGDSGGYFYKIQPWFEGGASVNANMSWPWNQPSWAYLASYTTTGGAYKQARYRWCYQPRSAPDSLNNYSNVFALVSAAAANANPNWPAIMKNVADMENWMRLMAANHAAGNWDCYGIQNGQNIYGYVSPAHRWTLYMFDFNISLGNRITWAAGANLETTTADFFANMYGAGGHPEFRRMYWRALKELANGIMRPEAFNPLLDAKFAALRASGIPAAAPSGDQNYAATARASITTQVATRDCAGCVPSASVFNTSSNVAVLGGVAAFDVVEIRVNGVSWPITWTSLSNWTMRVPAPAGSNVFSVVGCDRAGNLIAGASNQVSIVSTAPAPDAAVGSVVINEIMFNPRVPDAEYVELFNNSTTTAFDLSGWKFNGLNYTFPPGSMIAPRAFLVLARSRTVFAATYGVTVPVFDEFGGNLQFDGETLTLLQPGTPDVVISKVRYENTVPWPTTPGGEPTPASIQVIDPRQDIRRPCNWQSFSGAATTNFTWNFASVTANYTASGAGNRLWIFLTGAGDAYLDDVSLVPGAIAGVGSNFVRNGDLEGPLIDVPRVTNSWTVSTNYTNSILSTDLKHGGNASLHIVCSNAPASLSTNKVIYQNLSPGPTNGQLCTLSYWYRTGATSNNISVRTQSGSPASTNSIAPTLAAGTYAVTPGAANTGASGLPSIPPLWINEVLPFNTNGLADNQGEFEPWIELYNTGTNTVSLAGLTLANNFNDLAQWAFPSNATIGPGEFKLIIADGQTNQSTPGELHANFRLSPTNGTVVLAWQQFGQPAVLDYVNYTGVPVNYSFGSVPDGQPFDRQLMYYTSPAGTNNGAAAPIVISINEWMADNTRTLADPADSGYEDWFELFNPNPFPVDLTGWILGNSLTNGSAYSVPSGYVIPAGGFLLVWADNETGQNSTNRIDLHTSFKLSKAGETIVVRAPDGRLVDAVAFGAQSPDVSEGRYPDGSASRFFFTVPTPRAANVSPNHPPLLTPIGDKFLHLGETLAFTATANDPDLPPQVLSFGLDLGAPLGADLTLGGDFTWTPTPGQSPSTNSVTIRVTDSGVPPLSDSETIIIVVAGPPLVGGVMLPDGTSLQFTVSTLPGRRYQVFFKEELAVPGWTPVGPEQTATGYETPFTVERGTNAQRFYRIEILP